MKEYVILTILIIFLIFSVKYIVKAIKSSFLESDLICDNLMLLSQKYTLENNLDELEFDLETQKIDKEEYNNLRVEILNKIDLINKSDDKTKEENDLIIEKGENKSNCSACKKELEEASNFCKYCGAKV